MREARTSGLLLLGRPGLSRMAVLVAAVAGIIALSPGQSIASHVSCGDTITQDTTLDSDLIDCTGDGVVIGADDIALDLDGHTIDGEGDGSDEGVDNAGGFGDVAVENGSIKEFSHGVLVENASENTIRKLTVSDNRDAIRLVSSHENRIEENSVSHASDIFARGISIYLGSSNQVERNSVTNNRVGIDVLGSDGNRVHRNSVFDTDPLTTSEVFGIGVQASRDARVTKNSVFGYTRGISFIGVSGSSVERNSVSGSISAIGVSHSSANRVAGNEASRNDAIGIVLGNSENNRIEANSVSSNRVSGLVIDGIQSRNNHVERNLVFDNGGYGIFATGAIGNRIERNLVLANRRNGIYGDALIKGNAVLNNGDNGIWSTGVGVRVEENIVLGNGADGIFLDFRRGPGTLVERNRANRNGDDGIDVEAPQTTITRNTANRNVDLGIEAVPGVTDGGGNRARGNGNRLQCTNVRCGRGRHDGHDRDD